MHKIYASMNAIASYVPQNCIKNADFERTLDTSDEWITKRTGIKTRYFASSDESTSDLGVKAAELALKRAKMRVEDIDMVLCATLSPDYLTMPSTAAIISHKLGIQNKPAFDISSACSGFVYLLSLAKAYIESQMYKNILIIGAEKASSVLDFSDRTTCILFGDGAGAAIIGATEDKNKSILDVKISANGKYGNLLMTPRESADFFAPSNQKSRGCLQMSGNEIFKLAVKTLSLDVKEILERNNMTSDDIDFFVPHQANLRIINAVGDLINVKKEKIVLTVQKYGNTSAASIPMAIDDIYTNKRLKNGDLLLLDAFGGGLTWGSCLVYFNGE